MASETTPGPWVVSRYVVTTPTIYDGPIICGPEVESDFGRDRFVIAETRGMNTEANARLIAASPALLAALRACVEAHETGRYEPQRIAYEAAKNVLEDIDNA
jgi:hypothetical protein